jgi:hypothetical protein
MAPGVNIATTTLTSYGTYNSVFNGTSAATPNTAAVVALILQANPNLTSQQARDLLEQSCEKVGGYIYNSNVSGQPNGTWSTDAGYGRVSACRSVSKAILSSSTLNGPSHICVSETYNVPGLPNGFVVNWSASSSGLVTLTPSGNSVTVTKNGDGKVTLTATVSGPCGQIGTLSKQVSVGLPTPTFQPYGHVCNGETFTLKADPDPFASSHHWVAHTNAGDVPLSENGYWSVSVVPNTLYVDLFITNLCGTVDKKKLILYYNCGDLAGLLISPNPAKNSITVSIPKVETSTTSYHKINPAYSNSRGGFIRELYIYDSRGELKIRKKINGDVNQVEVNTSRLVPGIYIVQTGGDKGTRQAKLIIQ